MACWSEFAVRGCEWQLFRMLKRSVKQRQQSLKPLLEQLAAEAYQLNLTRDQVLAALKPLLKDLKND